MASRRDEKERLRVAREQAEAEDRKQERKRLILGYVVAGVITLAVVVGIVAAIAGGGEGGDTVDAGSNERLNTTFGSVPKEVTVDDRDSAEAPTGGATDLEATVAAAGCELITEQKDEGNGHLANNDPMPEYEANPPTSGDHSPDPLADGAFAETPSPLNYLHALEHGRIEIQYQSSLPEDQQLQLLGVYDEDRPGMIVFPNDDQPYLVAATAWRQTLGCKTFEGAATLDAIRAFRDAYRARGPEPIAMS